MKIQNSVLGISLMVVSLVSGVAHADRFSEFAEMSPKKHQMALSDPLSGSDQAMATRIEQYLSTALRVNQPVLQKYKRGDKNSRLTTKGMASIVALLDQKGWNKQVESGQDMIQPYQVMKARVISSGVVGGVYTWEAEIPMDLAFRDLRKKNQANDKERHVFKVRMVRSNEVYHANHTVIDHVELIK